MSLPKRNEKEYLKSQPSDKGFAVAGQKEHIDEIALLFAQHGLPCRKDQDVRPGEDVLRFSDGVDRARVEEVLESYKHVKGS